MSGNQPYLMPDGSSLKNYLRNNGFSREGDGGRSSHRRGKKAGGNNKKGGKAYSSRLQVAKGVISSVRTGKQQNPHESHELEGLSKLGVRKLMRYMGDRMLRDMAGPMTASYMDSLYQPVPFGDTGYQTAFRKLSENPNENEVWSKFLDISMDKERKVLELWEAHVKAEKKTKKQQLSPTQQAWSRWGRIQSTYRKILKKAQWQHVWDIESQILDFLQQEQVQDESFLDLPYDDSFGQMIIRGVAQYHRLKVVDDDDDLNTLTLVRRTNGQQEGALSVTCCDILEALEVHKGQGLNPSKLKLFLQENVNDATA